MHAVLVMQLARMGDLIQTKRLLLSLAAQPHTQVCLCVDHSLKEFAALLYPFARIFSLPAHNSGGKSTADVLKETNECCRQMQEESFHRVYTLNSSPLSYALARLFEPGVVHGYSADNGQNARNHLCSLASRWTADRLASPVNLVDFWSFFMANPIAPELVNPVAQSRGYNKIGVALAGREQRRSLPTPVLAQCLESIFRARGGPQIVCIGTAQEKRHVRELGRLLPQSMCDKLIDTTGATALADLPELISSLDCLITPDTGVMHLAAHLGVPVQAFFLSSAWCFETGPYGLGHKIWQATPPCAPCLESAPCRHSLVCRSPFGEQGFLAHLSGKYAPSWPDGLTGYISHLDKLGVTYTPVDGNNPGGEKRAARRNLLAAHLAHYPGPVPQGPANDLFYEADWMLPHREDVL